MTWKTLHFVGNKVHKQAIKFVFTPSPLGVPIMCAYFDISKKLYSVQLTSVREYSTLLQHNLIISIFISIGVQCERCEYKHFKYC